MRSDWGKMRFYLDLAAVFQVFTEFDVDKFGLTLLPQPFLFIIVPHDDMGLSEKKSLLIISQSGWS